MNSYKAYLLIGGNLGNREAFLEKAREGIAIRCGVITGQSSLYQTAAWGIEDQAAFLNQAVAIETTLTPQQLLATILSIEESIGRKRSVKYGPRTIDIDILLFAQAIINTTDLTVPHPELANRRFVLVPLAEIAASFVHPVLKKTVAELLLQCPDPLAVQKFKPTVC